MKYWAYIDNEILGPYEKEKLIQLPGFTPSILVCPQTPVGEKTEEWKEASNFPEIVALINIPSGQSLKESGEIKTAQPLPVHQPEANAGQSQPLPESLAASAETPAETSAAQHPKKISPLTSKPLTPVNLVGDDKPTQLEPPKTSEIHDSQIKKIAGTSFDPLTLSQIGRRFAEVKDEKPVSLPEDFSLSKPFLQKAPPREQAPSPESSPTDEPAPQISEEPHHAGTPEQGTTPEAAPQQIEQVYQPPKPEAQSFAPEQPPLTEQMPQSVPVEKKQEYVHTSPVPVGIDPMTLSQVNQKLQEVINSGILKQDFPEHIRFIVQKIGYIEESISIMQKSQFQKEIFDKISCLENSINEIKTKIAEKPVSATPQSFAATPPPTTFVTPVSVQPAPPKKEEVPQPASPEKKEEIHDEGIKAKTSSTGTVFKKLLNFVLTLVLILGILGVAAFILKQMDIFDVTNVIEIPFISKTQKTETPQETEPKLQAEFSQEAVNMVKEYLLKPGGDKLETIINKEANKLQTDINFGEWKTVKISDDIYNATISMPYNNGQSKLIYNFEVDFKNKVIKHLDEETKKLFELDKISQQPPQQRVTRQEQVQKPALEQPGKRRTNRTPRKQVQPSPQKQVQKKSEQKPTEEDEEYEYEYVEEDAAEGTEEEYMVPGIPKKR